MALDVGQNFKKRWLIAPDAVRQAFLDDLNRISELLQPETQFQEWLDKDQRAMQVAQLKIEEAYALEKARLIEEARVRKQLALEKSLSEKRAEQQAYNQKLLQDETLQFQKQTETLHYLRQHIDLDIKQYTDRYTENPKASAFNSSGEHFLVSNHEIRSELDSIRLRLELEAETNIEQAVNEFRNKLIAAAREEIEYILKNTEIDSKE